MMKYWEMFKEENEAVKERHELALERIGQFKTEETVAERTEAISERRRSLSCWPRKCTGCRREESLKH